MRSSQTSRSTTCSIGPGPDSRFSLLPRCAKISWFPRLFCIRASPSATGGLVFAEVRKNRGGRIHGRSPFRLQPTPRLGRGYGSPRPFRSLPRSPGQRPPRPSEASCPVRGWTTCKMVRAETRAGREGISSCAVKSFKVTGPPFQRDTAGPATDRGVDPGLGQTPLSPSPPPRACRLYGSRLSSESYQEAFPRPTRAWVFGPSSIRMAELAPIPARLLWKHCRRERTSSLPRPPPG